MESRMKEREKEREGRGEGGKWRRAGSKDKKGRERRGFVRFRGEANN